ncbi:MAG: ABC transporter permease [Thermosulfidibacteraceae bacterium]|jgi:NitT/TauT family transport system permease protein
MRFQTLSIPERRINVIDLVVALFLLLFLTLIISVTSKWNKTGYYFEVNLDPVYIPWYTAQSLVRMFIAYILSIVFSIWYGYTASKSRIHSAIMIPILDILQSIPVLSFMPAVTLAMISIFPNKRIGVEIASIFLIFTGQVWNLTFSYYHSINSVPREFKEAAYIFRFNKVSKFIRIDLPYSIIGLVWNSIMSVAGGWFFLMACEMFTLGDKYFRLPGLGSYIQTAAEKGNIEYVIYGIITMVATITILDFIIWQPLTTWAQRFKMEKVVEEIESNSIVYNILGKSKIANKLGSFIYSLITFIEKMSYKFERGERKKSKALSLIINTLWIALIGTFLFMILSKIELLLTTFGSLTKEEILLLLKSVLFSLMRVFLSITIALAWTLPIGVIIGMSKSLASKVQGIFQILASIPATAVFPLIVVIILKLNLPVDVASISLILLGTQWYLLFNIIAGAYSIPRDLIEVADLLKLKGINRWKMLLIPGILPNLLTGLITASGGAWNATIVSEFISYEGRILKTSGLGALIAESALNANFKMLLVSTSVMAMVVASINIFIWKRLFRVVKSRFILEE